MKGLIWLVVSIFSFGFTEAEAYKIFEDNGKVGLQNDEGKIIIPAAYESLGWSDGSLSVIQETTGYKLNGRWGIINLSNQKITQPLYVGLQRAESNLLLASQRKSGSDRVYMGCIDIAGKEIIPFQYDGVKVSSQHAVVFVKSGDHYKYGMVDLNNRVVIPIQYQYIKSLGSLRYAVQDEHHNYSLFSESAKPLTTSRFDDLLQFKKNQCIVIEKGDRGIIDRDGQWILQPQYRDVTIDEKSVATLAHNEWKILDGQNHVIQTVTTDSIIPLNNNLFALAKGKELALVNGQFAPITTTTFSSIEPFIKNKSIVTKDGLHGIISSNGKLLVDCRYTDIIVDHQYVIAAIQKNKWMLLDSIGNQKTTKPYESIEPFNGKFFHVKSKNFYGAINASGQEVIACVYDSLLHYKEGRLAVKFHNAYGIIDMDENWIVPPQPNKVTLISVDRYIQQRGATFFLKSFDGEIIYFTDNRLRLNGNYLMETVSNGSVYKIDFDGRIVSRQLPPEYGYEKIFPESEGLRGIKRHGQYGFVDDQGRLRIANRYDDIKPFQERLAGVKILGKWGFIDHDENLVIQPVHEQTTSFTNGAAIVMQKEKYGLINVKGDVILPLRYHQITRLNTNRFILENDGVKGLADSDGHLIVPPKYDNLIDLNNGYFIVVRNHQYGLISNTNVSTIPLTYDYLMYDSSNARYLALNEAQWKR